VKLLFVSPQAFYPEASGGAQHSTLYLLKQLQKRHWDIRVICKTSPLGDHSFMKRVTAMLPPLVQEDNGLGFRCKRHLILPKKAGIGYLLEKSWRKAVQKELGAFLPDILLGDFLATDPIYKKAIKSGIVCIKFIRSLPFLGAPSIIPEDLHILGNSPYTASVAQAVTGHPHDYILPFVEPGKYFTNRLPNGKITFINPIPQKGVDIAVKIAKEMPDKQFLFVLGGWSRYPKILKMRFVRSVQNFPNVQIMETQTDMRHVYAQTKILLVPSQYIETFGRIIREAQLNGILVVASDVGGIPHTMGEGGILVRPKNDVRGYIEALRLLSEDEKKYRNYSDLAVENSNKAEFDPEVQVEKFIAYVNRIM